MEHQPLVISSSNQDDGHDDYHPHDHDDDDLDDDKNADDHDNDDNDDDDDDDDPAPYLGRDGWLQLSQVSGA